MNTIPRPLAKSGPTEDILRQCGHRAKALFNVLNCKIKFQLALEQHLILQIIFEDLPKMYHDNGHSLLYTCLA